MRTYIFGLHPHLWHRTLKSRWNFLSGKITVLFVIHNEPLSVTPEYVNEVTLERPHRQVLVARGTNQVTRGSDLSAPPPSLSGKGERLEIEFSH